MPRLRLTLWIFCVLWFGCERNLPPQAREILAPEAMLDQDDVGLVEPRVQVMSAPVAGALSALPPELSATATTRFFPEGARTVSEVRELLLIVEVKGAAEQRQLTLELLQPGGVAYEVRAANVGGDPWASYRVSFVLPVAGTAIDRGSLAGQWSANYLLAGEPLASSDFQLEW